MIYADPVNHQTADTLAEVLDKLNVPRLKHILRTLGHERCTALLDDIRTDTTPYTLDGFRVWLPTIPSSLREEAIAALKKGDVADFIRTTHSPNRLALVACNISLLQHRGLYEAALLKAFLLSGTNRLRDPLLFQRSLFMLGDRQKLRDAGDPLPGPAPYTLYRGVAGVGTLRSGQGLSWTGSLEMATEFATMYDLPAPAVFQAAVSEQKILSYTYSLMKEDEYIVMLSSQTRIKRYKGCLPYVEVFC